MLSAGLCSIRLIRSRLPTRVRLHQLHLSSLPPIPKVAPLGILFTFSFYFPKEHIAGWQLIKLNENCSETKGILLLVCSISPTWTKPCSHCMTAGQTCRWALVTNIFFKKSAYILLFCFIYNTGPLIPASREQFPVNGRRQPIRPISSSSCHSGPTVCTGFSFCLSSIKDFLCSS